MAVTRVRRQIVLFLFGVFVPGVVLLIFGLMLIQQESELSQRREADALSIRARTLADSVDAWLDAGFAETSDSLRSGRKTRHPATQDVLLVGTYSDGVYLSAASHLPSSSPLSQSKHSSFIRAVQRQEFALGQGSAAIRSLQTRISTEQDSTRVADLRVRLSRALFDTNQADAASVQAQLVMKMGPEIIDEFGTPLALYVAELLIENSQPDGVCDRLSAIADINFWMTQGAVLYLSDLEGRAGCSADIALAKLSNESAVSTKVAALGERLLSDRTGERWMTLSDSWLVRRVDGDRREPEVVIAVRIADIANRLIASGAKSLSVATLSQSLTDNERLLAPTFPSLRVEFHEVAAQAMSRLTLFGLAILLVMLMTVVGGYVLWRDLRRETRLSNLQTQFVTSVSHELRTPLTSIRLFSEAMLEYDSVDGKEREQGLRVIAHESGRLSRMLNNVLNTTRVERGTMTYHLTPGDLADPAENAIEAMLHEYEQADLEIERDLALARGNFDPDTMEQAILNLLSNALKYASSGGRVVVRSWEENGHAAVSVKDFGPGIPREEQQRVFERFYRLNGDGGEGGPKMPGTGLGLALIRHIATGHGGEIILDSTPGSGSQFTIQLPLYA